MEQKMEFSKVIEVDGLTYVATEALLQMDVFDAGFELVDKTIFEETVTFEDGTWVEIRVCTGQHNAWAESIWYDANNKVLAESEPWFHLSQVSYYESDKAVYEVHLCSNTDC